MYKEANRPFDMNMWSYNTGKPRSEEMSKDWNFDGRVKNHGTLVTNWTTDSGLKHTREMWTAPLKNGGVGNVQVCSWDGFGQEGRSKNNSTQCQVHQHSCSSLSSCLRQNEVQQAWLCHPHGQGFSSILNVNRHSSGHTTASQGKLQCETCEKDITHLPSPQTHVETQPIQRLFPCQLCEKNFTTKAYLKTHMRIHTGDKPYKCQTCDKAFSQLGTLKNHTRTHTGEKPYMCAFCSMCFTSKGNMTTHARIHTADKPYKCTMCEKKFSQLGSLKVHKRTHTGERPFTCEVCGMKCITKGNLKTHSYTHTGEKPYKCHVCNKQFSQRGSLKSHMQTHGQDT